MALSSEDASTCAKFPATSMRHSTLSGQDLRTARLRRGDDLATVSRYLKIRKDHLEALEEDRIEALPGRTYAVGFIRSYADYLGLDAVQCVERFKAEIAGRTDPTVTPITVIDEDAERRMPHGWKIMAGVVVVLVLLGAYQVAASVDRMMSEKARRAGANAGQAAGGAQAHSAKGRGRSGPACKFDGCYRANGVAGAWYRCCGRPDRPQRFLERRLLTKLRHHRSRKDRFTAKATKAFVLCCGCAKRRAFWWKGATGASTSTAHLSRATAIACRISSD